MSEITRFYQQPSPTSGLGRHRDLLPGLPADSRSCTAPCCVPRVPRPASGAASPALYGNGELWGWDELRGSLINDVAALNKVEVAGWYWCDRLKVEPLDQPHDELDTSLDVLSRLAATAESVEAIRECFDRYPEFQPPADAVAR